MSLPQGALWYRGRISRSYVPPTIFVSVGYAICLTIFSVFSIFSGIIMTSVSHGNNTFRTIGHVSLGIGVILLLISLSLCFAVYYLARKQENDRSRRQDESGQHLTAEILLQPPPASAYPHQPTPQNYPTTYPIQTGDQFYPGSNYPSQSQYPPQPGNNHPPPYVYPQSRGSPYPSADYPKPMSNASQWCVPTGDERTAELNKQSFQ